MKFSTVLAAVSRAVPATSLIGIAAHLAANADGRTKAEAERDVAAWWVKQGGSQPEMGA